MDMCYDGTLVMPSKYAKMEENEMCYIQGGGTVKVIASSSTVRTICRSSVALIGTAIGEAFGGPILAKLTTGALATLIYDFIIDKCGVKYPSINKSFTKSIYPNVTFNLNKYV